MRRRCVRSRLVALAWGATVLLVPGCEDPEAWYSETVPDSPALSEDDFRGQDPRYLTLLHSLARTILALSHGSAEFEIGQQFSVLADATAYQSMLAQAPPGSELPPGMVGATGRPDYTHEVRTGNVSRSSRVVASETNLRVKEESRFDERSWTQTAQRAWGGAQYWGQSPLGAMHASTQLEAAGSHGSNWVLQRGWRDVHLLGKALATLIAMGAPQDIREASDSRGYRVVMTWQVGGNSEVRVGTDPHRGYVPVEWTRVTRYDLMQEFANTILDNPDNEMAQRVLKIGRWAIEEWITTLPNELHRRITFTDWQLRGAGTWLPGRMEMTVEPRRGVTEAGRRGESTPAMVDIPKWLSPFLDGVSGRFAAPEARSWVEWTRARGRVSPREAFAPPPGYEPYTGQEWVDVIMPHDPGAQAEMVAGLWSAMSLSHGEDLTGARRWVVADVNLVELGVWPFERHDVLLQVGTVALDGAHSQPLNAIATALEGGTSYAPVPIRLARGETIVDVLCWFPESSAAGHQQTVYQRMLTQREYPPLPSKKIEVFAEAVRDATQTLARSSKD